MKLTGKRWWRRRESNPHPKVATSGIYTFSQFTFSRRQRVSELTSPLSRHTRLTFKTRSQVVNVPELLLSYALAGRYKLTSGKTLEVSN